MHYLSVCYMCGRVYDDTEKNYGVMKTVYHVPNYGGMLVMTTDEKTYDYDLCDACSTEVRDFINKARREG